MICVQPLWCLGYLCVRKSYYLQIIFLSPQFSNSICTYDLKYSSWVACIIFVKCAFLLCHFCLNFLIPSTLLFHRYENDMRVRTWWQDFNLQVMYSFKHLLYFHHGKNIEIQKNRKYWSSHVVGLAPGDKASMQTHCSFCKRIFRDSFCSLQYILNYPSSITSIMWILQTDVG